MSEHDTKTKTTAAPNGAGEPPHHEVTRHQPEPLGTVGERVEVSIDRDARDTEAEGPVDKAKQQLDQAKEKVQEVADKVGEKLTDAQIGERLEEAKEEARRRAEELGVAAKDQYETRSEQLKEGYGKVQENMVQASDDLGTFVRHNPGRAVLIAGAAGFLVSLLFRGRKTDRPSTKKT